jgi:hypothetical protein
MQAVTTRGGALQLGRVINRHENRNGDSATHLVKPGRTRYELKSKTKKCKA